MPLDAARSRRRWSWPKRAIVVAVSLFGPFLLWILLLNIALWSGFVARAVSGTHRMSTLELEYGSAWTLWPTRVHVQDLTLRIDAYRYQLELVVPEGEIDISMWELLARRFHAQSIEADEVRAKFRFKAPEGRVSERRLEALAEIEGMGPPVRQSEPPDLPDVDEAWEVHLENIDARLVSLWISELDFTPIEAQLTGAMRSRSGDLFAIDDVGLDVHSAELYIEDELMAEHWSGELELDMLDYNPFEVVDRAPLAQLSLQLDAGADVVSMGALAPYLDGVPLQLDGGKGPLELALDVERGMLMPGTEILYRTEALAFRSGQWRGRTGMRFAFGVDEHGRRARAAADLRGVEVGRGDASRGAITAEHASAWLVAEQTNLIAKELPIVGGELHVPELVVADFRALDGVTKAIDLRGGKAELALHTKMTKPGHLEHEVSGKVSRVNVRSKKGVVVRASGDFSARLHSDAKLRTGESEELAVTVRDFVLDTKHGHSEDTWVQVKRGSVAWDLPEKKLDARLKGRLDDLRPILAHVDDRKRVVELVKDLELTHPFDFDVALHRVGKEMDIRVHQFDRPGLEIEGVVHRVGERSRSAFRLERVELGLVRDENRERALYSGADEAWLQMRTRWARAL